MAFFDVPADDEVPPEAKPLLDAYRRRQGADAYPRTMKVFSHLPKILKARIDTHDLLYHQSEFPRHAQHLAWMLVAHAKGCRVCFAGSRRDLDKLGFDEETLDGICANPDTLPLNERDRLFVRYILKIATDLAGLQLKDFQDMETHGFSKDDILEMIAYAANMNFFMTFTMALFPALYEED
jgi:alkylhydroperoxidase family enzyme